MLADGAAQDNPLSGVSSDERKLAYENRLRSEVETIVSSVVGPGHARVQINADFDVNRITQTSDKFDPDGRVVRSSQTREEQSATSDNKEGTVSVGTELPGGKQQAEGASQRRSEPQDRGNRQLRNFAHHQDRGDRGRPGQPHFGGRAGRRQLHQERQGRDSPTSRAPKEEIDRIAALVRSAIGFDAKRGDQVEVVNLRFAETTPSPINEPTGWMSYLQFTKDDIMRGAETRRDGGARPGRDVHGGAPAGAPDHHAGRRDCRGQAGMAGAVGARASRRKRLPAGGMGIPGVGTAASPSTGGPNISIVGGDEAVAISNRTSAMIDIAKVQGQVHAQSVQKVGELADKNPHEAVSIIRNWLHEDAA